MIRCAVATVAVLAAVTGLARAETVISVTQVSYNYNNQPVCTAVRMNAATYGSLPSDACTLGTAGSYGNDRITENVYDAAGQLTQVIQAYGTSDQRVYATYSYSDNGKVIDTIDANGNRSHNVYDGLDRLITYNYPSTTRPTAYNPTTQANALATAGAYNASDYEAYTYDANNNKLTTRRRDNQVLTDCYDALGQLIVHYVHSQSGCTATGGAADVYTVYDGLGHITSKRFASTSGSGVSYAYDGLGRMTSTTDYYGRTLSYQYDQANARTRLTWGDGNYIGYALDNADRLNTLGWNSTSGLFAVSYTSLGQVHKLLRGGTISGSEGPEAACVTQDGATCYDYDASGRLSSFGQNLPGSTYDIGWSFAYTPANQIVNWSASTTVFDYQGTANNTVNQTYDGLNRDAGIAALTGGYDARGNLTYDGTRTFAYDVENRLLTGAGGTASLAFVYDPEGRLVSYTAGSTQTTFQYDGTDLIAEYSGTSSSATPLRRYVHGSGTDDPEVWLEGGSNSDIRYAYANYQGSVIATANAAGTSLTTYKYGPYGEPKDGANADSWSGFRFRYTGQTMLYEAKLYYYKARVYDPNFARFLQTDPIGSKDDLDLYAYVGGDPINDTDPTGEMSAATSWQASSDADAATEITIIGRRRICDATCYAGMANQMAAAQYVRFQSFSLGIAPEEFGPMMEFGKAGAEFGFKTLGEMFKDGRVPSEQELVEFAKSQGWKEAPQGTGPRKFLDQNGIPRIIIKEGSARTPGSEQPHAEFRNAEGNRISPDGRLVTRKSLDNHSPITLGGPIV